ncbi:hypothetical protein [Bradyrhizobium sp. USDA 4451]
MVSVGVVKDGKLRYVTYAVAMADQAEAVKASLDVDLRPANWTIIG